MKVRQNNCWCTCYILCLENVLRTIFFCLFCFVAPKISAQSLPENDYSIEKFNAENGLPQNSVRAIQADKRGYVWIATEFGLVRFDGLNFKVYNSENTPSIKSNRILAIAKNLSEDLLIVDGFNNLLRINEESNTIDSIGQYRMDNDTALLFSGNYMVPTAKLVPEDSIQKKLYESLTKGTQFKNTISLSDAAYYCAITDSEGYMIFKNGGIVYIANRNIKKVCDLTPSLNLPICFKRNDTVYVFEKRCFIEIEKGVKTGRVFEITGDLLKTNFYANRVSSSGIVDNSLVMVLENAVYALTFKENVVQTKKLFALSSKEIISFLYLPVYDVYFIGSLNDGMQILRKKKFIPVKTDLNEFQANNYYAQARVNNNWVLTHTGVLDIQSRKIVRKISFLNRYSMLHRSNGSVGYCVLEPGRASSVRIADSGFNTIQKYTGHGEMRALTEDSLGRLWSGMSEFLYATRSDDSMHRLINLKQIIEIIYPKNNNTLWIGTRQGLFEYDINHNTAALVKQTEHLYVRNIYRSKDGNLWIGTYGQGFYLYQGNQFIKMPLDDGQRLATAHCFVEDGNGFFWIPTNNGLFRVFLSELYDFASGRSDRVYYHYYDKKYGFNTNEFNGGCVPCSLTLPGGIVSLPSLDGLVWFNPMNTTTTWGGREIVIDKIMLNDSAFTATNMQLQFPSSARTIEIELSTPFFEDKSNLQFEYRFDLNDTTWKKISLNRIMLSKLSSGKHVLTIRKRIGFGAGNFAYKQLNMSIQKKWHEQLGYRILMALLLIGTVFALSELRLRFIRKQNKALEMQVSKRTAELNGALQQLKITIDELETSQKDLRKTNELKDRLASILAHDLKSSIRFTSTLSSHLHKKLIANDYSADLAEIASELSKTTKGTYEFIEEFLLWISSQKGGYKIKSEPLNMEVFFQELQSFFDEVVKLNENQIHFPAGAADCEINTDRQILKIIVRNIIDNANKYTSNGKIYVTGCRQDGKYTIVVRDTGKGIPAGKLETLMRTDVYDSGGTSRGLGYQIISDLKQLINVTINIESVINKGTTVSVIIPEK